MGPDARAVQPGGFICQAYGSEGIAFGAVCFFSRELGKRVCADQKECQQAMSVERPQVFRRINEGAAAGQPEMEYLAGEFTSPDQILGLGGPQPGQGRKRRKPDRP